MDLEREAKNFISKTTTDLNSKRLMGDAPGKKTTQSVLGRYDLRKESEKLIRNI